MLTFIETLKVSSEHLFVDEIEHRTTPTTSLLFLQLEAECKFLYL